MSISRQQLDEYGTVLTDLIPVVDAYEGTVRGQVTAICTCVDAVAASWSGPIPQAVTGRARRWVGEIYEAGNVISAIQPILFAWAQRAWSLSDELPDTPVHDPDLQLVRQEVAAEWQRSCTFHGDQLAEVLRLLRRSAEADTGGPFDAFGDMLDHFGDFFRGGFSGLSDLFAAMAGSAVPSSWAEWMRGQSPRREDMDLARISDDVYDVEGWHHSRTIGSGWRRVPASELPAGLTMADFENGDFGNDLRAALYTDGDGHYVLAFAGTDSFSDGVTDVIQATTPIRTAQYEQARSLTEKLHGVYGSDLVLTGHSLGGSVASYGALATGSTAVTFNSAGLSDANIEYAGRGGDRQEIAESGQVRAYHVESDVLTNTQQALTSVPDAVGSPITIGDPVPPPALTSVSDVPFLAFEQQAHAGKMHGTSSVLAGLQSSELTFHTTYYVETSDGTETRSTPQTSPAGWFG